MNTPQTTHQNPMLWIATGDPQQTNAAISYLKQHQPTVLYVAADGPVDLQANADARAHSISAALQAISWVCEPRSLLSPQGPEGIHAFTNALRTFSQTTLEGFIFAAPLEQVLDPKKRYSNRQIAEVADVLEQHAPALGAPVSAPQQHSTHLTGEQTIQLITEAASNLSRGDARTALALIQKANEQPYAVQSARFIEAHCWLHLKEHREAAQCLWEELSRFPENTPAREQLEGIYGCFDPSLSPLSAMEHHKSLVESIMLNRPAKEDGLPIIFVHQGASYYLRWSLTQAKLANPRSPIYLLTDVQWPDLPFVQCIPIDRFSSDAREFEKIYTHLSTNSLTTERFCFQRWFIIRDFIKAYQIESFLHLDSDVLLFSDITEDPSHFAGHDFTLSCQHSPHSSFFRKAQIVSDLCNFVHALFSRSNPVLNELLFTEIAIGQKHGHNDCLSDMVALRHFAHSFDYFSGDTTTIINGSCFDHHVGAARRGFAMNGDQKDLQWVDGVPMGHNQRFAEPVRFKSLHYCGIQKKYMCRDFFRAQHRRSVSTEAISR